MPITLATDMFGNSYEVTGPHVGGEFCVRSGRDIVKTFGSKKEAEGWVYRQVTKPAGLTAHEVAAAMLKHIKGFEHLWRQTPASFAGASLFAEILNRMQALKAECNRQLHSNGKDQ